MLLIAASISVLKLSGLSKLKELKGSADDYLVSLEVSLVLVLLFILFVVIPSI
jgi:hypothetical protein